MKPDFAEAFANRAQVYAELQNKPEAAFTDIDKALKLNSGKPEFYRIKSTMLINLNRNKEACTCLKNGMDKGLKTLAEDYKERCSK